MKWAVIANVVTWVLVVAALSFAGGIEWQKRHTTIPDPWDPVAVVDPLVGGLQISLNGVVIGGTTGPGSVCIENLKDQTRIPGRLRSTVDGFVREIPDGAGAQGALTGKIPEADLKALEDKP
jgi:hypothetical protein